MKKVNITKQEKENLIIFTTEVVESATLNKLIKEIEKCVCKDVKGGGGMGKDYQQKN